MSPRDRRLWLVVVGAPVVVGLAGYLAAASFADQLPDPVATHWGTGAGPDGFSARSTGVALSALGAPIGLATGVIVGAVGRKINLTRRMAGGVAGGLAAFVCALGVGSLWTQRGLADAHAAPDPVLGLVLGVLLGGLVGVLCGWLVPALPDDVARATGPIPAQAPRAALAPGQSAAWAGLATSGPALGATLAVVVGPLVVLAVLGVVPWVLTLIVVPAVVLVLATMTFRVTVGRQGLVVRSPLGWPCFTVPLTDVAEAEATSVSPMRDFGGWGIRTGFHTDRIGIVTRRGEALDVTKGDGTHLVVTVDRAAEAAGLLNTLAERARGDGVSGSAGASS